MAKIGNLIPLLILLIVVGVGAFIGYSLYTWSNELAERGKKKMEKKNVAFTKEGGLRVGVKEMHDEKYADKTQNVLVNVWNNAALPNYKSKLGWNSTQTANLRAETKKNGSSGSSTTTGPNGGSRSTSAATSAPASKLSTPQARPAASRRSPSTPGGWD